MLRAFAHAEEPPTRPGLVSSGPIGSSCPSCGPQQLLVFLPLQGDRLFLLLPESVFVICSWKHHLIKQALSGPASQRQRLTWAPRGRWRGAQSSRLGVALNRKWQSQGDPPSEHGSPGINWLQNLPLQVITPQANRHQDPGVQEQAHTNMRTHTCARGTCVSPHTRECTVYACLDTHI